MLPNAESPVQIALVMVTTEYANELHQRLIGFSQTNFRVIRIEDREHLIELSSVDPLDAAVIEISLLDQQQEIIHEILRNRSKSPAIIGWRKSSSTRWSGDSILESLDPPTLKTGDPVGIILKAIDHHNLREELTLANTEALQRERNYQNIIEKSKDGILIVGDGGKICFCNLAAEKLFGRTKQELTESHFGLPLNSEYNPEIKILRPGNTESIEAEMNVVETTWEGEPAKLVNLRNITERRQDLEKLQIQHQALESAANIIVITDSNANILYTNPAFTKFTGYTAEEVAGQNPRILQSGKHKPAFYQEMWSKLSSGKTWQGEMINLCKDGSEMVEQATITPVKNKNQKITHYIAIKEEITEKLKTEKQLRRAQRMENMGLLASGVAHDLNNVLTPMQLSVDLLKNNPTPELLETCLISLEKSIERGAGIVRQILTFSRGTGGEMSPIQIRHLIKDIINFSHETFPKAIEIKSNINRDIPLISCNPTQIHQILMNLMLNARDAQPSGGHIEISTETVTITDSRQFLNLTLSPGDYVVIMVEDQGTGIPVSLHEQIFDPFYTSKEIGKGTGLGLPSVINILKNHNGFIELHSTPGIGSKFRVFLPTTKESIKVKHSAPHEEQIENGHGHHILVVEDEVQIRKAIQSLLERHGYSTTVASNGSDALLAIQHSTKPISAVISDLMMPVMSGAEFAESVLKQSYQLPFIIISGLMQSKSAKEELEKLKAMGIHTFLPKPFKGDDLLKALAENIVRK